MASADGRAALPVELTTFVGRHEQVADLTRLLGKQRVVTVVGVGGCGKTRLAVEVLSASPAGWSDGIGWVDLGPVADPARVPEVVGRALGALVGATTDPTAALVNALRDQEVVVCIDNCEHLLDSCGDLVETLLQRCPGVSILATSREPLGVKGETVWRVPAMAEDDIVALFCERARAVWSDFALQPSNEDTIRTICRRLDSMPLAVELAAAWVRVLTPTQIEEALDDRFRLLVGGSRRGVARHQTLLASVEWSYDLLGDDAQTLLRRLAIFPTTFDLAAAESVCSDDALPSGTVLNALGRLVDASIAVVDNRHEAARYGLPETIRELAFVRLVEEGDTASIRDRHLLHYLRFAEEASSDFDGGDQDAVLERLEAEHDNLRSAIDWGLGGSGVELGTRLVAALVRLWFLHGHAREGIASIVRALDLSDESSPLRARLHCGLGLLAIPTGRMDLCTSSSWRAIELARAVGDERTLALAHACAGYVPFFNDYARSREVAIAAQELGVSSGETFAADFGLLLETVSLANEDRYDEVIPRAEELLTRVAPRNDRFCAAFSRNVLVYAMVHTGDVRQAIAFGRDAVRFARPLRDYFTTGTVTSDLAWAYGCAGQLDEARELVDPLVRSIDAAGSDVDVIGLRVTVGKLHLWAGDLDRALAWLGRAADYADPGEDNWTAMRALPGLADALRRLGRWEEAVATGRRGADMAARLGTPNAEAESLDVIARVLLHQGVLDDAGVVLHRALGLRVESGLRTHIADSLDGLARLAAVREEHMDAVRLLAASDAARAASGYPRPVVDADAHTVLLDELALTLGSDRHGDAHAEGLALDLGGAVAYVTRARGRRGRPSAGWASLTPTEHEVVALVVEGLSNPQIAERMFISRATVKTHLSHVFAKLTVSSRAELAALATRRRLDDLA